MYWIIEYNFNNFLDIIFYNLYNFFMNECLLIYFIKKSMTTVDLKQKLYNKSFSFILFIEIDYS